jgi:hypothetical protein
MCCASAVFFYQPFLSCLPNAQTLQPGLSLLWCGCSLLFLCSTSHDCCRKPRGRPSAAAKAKKTSQFIDDEAQETFVPNSLFFFWHDPLIVVCIAWKYLVMMMMKMPRAQRRDLILFSLVFFHQLYVAGHRARKGNPLLLHVKGELFSVVPFQFIGDKFLEGLHLVLWGKKELLLL